MIGLIRVNNVSYRFLGACPTNEGAMQNCPPPVSTTSVDVNPTSTVLHATIPIAPLLQLDVVFLSTMFTDDYPRLSRPISYVQVSLKNQDRYDYDVEIYLDATGQLAVNNENEMVQWNDPETLKLNDGSALRAVRIVSSAGLCIIH